MKRWPCHCVSSSAMSNRKRGRADAALAAVDLHGRIHFGVGMAAATGIVNSGKDTLYGDTEIAH